MKQTAFLRKYISGSVFFACKVVNALAILVIVLGPCTVTSAEFAINWSTIDGGGGTSTGGVYAVTGTIGQPDATTTAMTGGPYSMTGGFWAIYAVPTPGAPFLSIVAAGTGQATISWEPDSPGWVLQETLNLTAAAWTNSPSGTNNPVIVPATLPTKFYRLHKPRTVILKVN